MRIHHNASMQVFPEGEGRTRLVWITDLLPNDLAGPVGALVEQGASVVKLTLERAGGKRATEGASRGATME